MVLFVACAAAAETVDAVVLEGCHHFAVAAKAQLLVVVVGTDGLEFLGLGSCLAHHHHAVGLDGSNLVVGLGVGCCQGSKGEHG